MLTTSDLSVRLAQSSDLHFIKDSWTKTMKYSYPNQYVLDFAPKFQAKLDQVIPHCVILVATLDSDPSNIISYLVYTIFKDSLIILFAYTLVDERKQGFCNHLLNIANPYNNKIILTSPTKNPNILQHLAQTHIFDPDILSLVFQ